MVDIDKLLTKEVKVIRMGLIVWALFAGHPFVVVMLFLSIFLDE